jgi:hypothetical protein
VALFSTAVPLWSGRPLGFSPISRCITWNFRVATHRRPRWLTRGTSPRQPGNQARPAVGSCSGADETDGDADLGPDPEPHDCALAQRGLMLWAIRLSPTILATYGRTTSLLLLESENTIVHHFCFYSLGRDSAAREEGSVCAAYTRPCLAASSIITCKIQRTQRAV